METITHQGDSQFVSVTKYYDGDQIKGNEMGKTLRHGRFEVCILAYYTMFKKIYIDYLRTAPNLHLTILPVFRIS
jgi:hypothetical protein